MHYCFTALVFSLTLFIKAYGQNDNAEEPKPRAVPPARLISKVEFLAGPSVVFYRGDEYFNIHDALKIGFSLNLALTHKFTSRFASTLKVAYENKGAKTILYSVNDDFTPPAIEKNIQKVSFNYVTATLLPNYSIIGNQRLYVGFGPYLGYVASGRVYQELYRHATLVSRSGGRPDLNLDYKTFDLGLTILLGHSFPVREKRSGSIQVLYSRGLVDITQPMRNPLRNTSVTVLFGSTIK